MKKNNKKRLSLKDKARYANGKSRACAKCPNTERRLLICGICYNAFVEDYTKGYKAKTKELKLNK